MNTVKGQLPVSYDLGFNRGKLGGDKTYNTTNFSESYQTGYTAGVVAHNEKRLLDLLKQKEDL